MIKSFTLPGKFGMVGAVTIGLLALFCTVIPAEVQAVTVGPSKLEYSVDPGQVIKGEIYLKNEESDTKTLYPSVEGFTEQNGDKQFIKEKSLIGTWLSTQSGVLLKSGQDTKVPFSITVPKDAPPGGQFAVIWWSTTPPASGAASTKEQVSIQTRAGILVYLNVSGAITESATITAFGPQNGSSISGSTEVPFVATVSNEGNVYIHPEGTFTITSLIGSKVADMPLNPKGLQILPHSFRSYIDIGLKGSWFMFGPYKAEAHMLYGKDNKQVVASKWIWVFPIRLIVITLSIIVGLFIILSVFFKMYNAWLLKKFGIDQR